MSKTGQEIASYYWISGKTPTKNSLEECSLKILVSIVKMDIAESGEKSNRARQLYKNISMLFLFPVPDVICCLQIYNRLI